MIAIILVELSRPLVLKYSCQSLEYHLPSTTRAENVIKEVSGSTSAQE